MLIKVDKCLINTDQLLWVDQHGTGCLLGFAVTQGYGNWQAGGSGNYNVTITTKQLSMSLDDFYTLYNKELALIKAMEEAARGNRT